MISLHPIKTAEIEGAKTVMDQVFQGLWGMTFVEIQAQYDPFQDLADIQTHYFANKGVFLVLAEDDRVIGTGGLSRFDDETALIKRVWLLKEYRGRGLGRMMVQALLEFARSMGYRRIRLTVATPDLQPEAVGLYTALGFQPGPPDPHNPRALRMELILENETVRE
jgi:putative acetyltransferase